MRKFTFLASALFAAMLALPAYTQEAAKSTAVKPADPESKVVLDSWNEIGRKLIAMAEDFPEDKYDFKATPAQRSFAEQLLHAAGANYYFKVAASPGWNVPTVELQECDEESGKALVTQGRRAAAAIP